jgi:hypothetical protein
VATPSRSPQPRRRAAQPAPRRAAEPAAKPRPAARGTRARRARHRGAIAWIVVSAVLLGGLVFINLAVLRLNLSVNRLTQERTTLRANDAALQSELSAAVASVRIQQLAQSRDGLVQADPSSIGYIDLNR